jgi:acyl carrier protein
VRSERGAILDGVREVFAEHLAIHDLTEETQLIRDLKLDSLQQLTLVVELENRFRIAFGEGDEAGIEKVGDVVDLLERRLSGSPEPREGGS